MTKRKLLFILIRALFMSFFPKRSDKRKLQHKFITRDIELKFDSYMTFEIGEWYIIALNLMGIKVEEGQGFVMEVEAWPIQLGKIGERPFGDPIAGEIHAKVEK